jgi:hypothetical protein
MGTRRRPTRPLRASSRLDPGRSPLRVVRRRTSRWPILAVLGLVLATVSILLVNQNHSGDPLKVRRELRKF